MYDVKYNVTFVDTETRIKVTMPLSEKIYESWDVENIRCEDWVKTRVVDPVESQMAREARPDTEGQVDDRHLCRGVAITVGQVLVDLVCRSAKHAFPGLDSAVNFARKPHAWIQINESNGTKFMIAVALAESGGRC